MRSLRVRVVLLVVACSLAGAGLLTVSANGNTAALTTPSPEPTDAATDASTDALAVTPTTPVVPTISPTPSPPSLAMRIDALLADPALAGIAISLSVRDQDGVPIVERKGAQPLIPASTSKLITAAAALGRLGPSYRYRTQVVTSTGPSGDGVLQGDVVLIGSGDPTLSTQTFRGKISPQRPSTSIEALADAVVARGVRHITGDVVADATVFADQPAASGWRERYFTELDATYTSGLTIDGGQKLFVEGGKLQATVSPDPASEAAAALFVALGQRGVQVDGGVRRLAQPTSSGLVLAHVESPALTDLLQWMVQRSDNHMADAIFRTLGAVAADPTWAGSAKAVQSAAAPLGLDWTGVQLADGSGLSRDNRVSADFLTRLDLAISHSGTAQLWAGWQAMAGRSGTLRKRLIGTLAEDAFRGKTGSLEDVRALSGAVLGPDGRRAHFALMANSVPRAARPAVRLLQDELVLALAEELHGCVRVPSDGHTTASEPPYRLSCAA